MELPSNADFGEVSVQPRIIETTFFHRADTSIRIIDYCVLPKFPSGSSIRWGEIGVGSYDKSSQIFCPYTPYRLAAFLETCKHPYEAVFVDIQQQPLDYLRRASHMYISKGQFEQSISSTDAWIAYCRDFLHREPEQVEYMDSGLKLRSPDPYTRQQAIGKGIEKARVPASFRRGVAESTIQFIQADITKPSKELPRGKLHFVDMNFLLYQLKTTEAQWQALQNAAEMVQNGGFLYTEDDLQYSPFIRHPHIFTDDTLRDRLGLTIAFSGPTSYDSVQSVLFQKRI